jgi:hypothetical protein
MFCRRIVAENDPSETPDASEDSKKVEDPFPTQLFGKNATQKKSNTVPN